MQSGELIGGKRFEILSPLGSGGMGQVYKVFDHELRTIVALKTLRATSPSALFRFKQEFRALCDVSHPNLVPLYELLVADDRWMFTMEHVDGSNLMTYLRPDVIATRQEDTVPAEVFATRGEAAQTVVIAPAPTDLCRHVFRQLAEGLHFLHDAGKLHRDVKPSNILVSTEGRVVVLDFGLVTALGGTSYPVPASYVLGTPGYVAPEVLGYEVPSPPADWYSFGAVLYEALTGCVPRRAPKPGDTTSGDRPSPRELPPDADPELSELALSLLDPDPDRRPRGDRVLERLGVGRPSRRLSPPLDRRRFVGRAPELARLEVTLAASRDQPQTVFISGPSGIGKTTLVASVGCSRCCAGSTARRSQARSACCAILRSNAGAAWRRCASCSVRSASAARSWS